jgi:hypothetical protein
MNVFRIGGVMLRRVLGVVTVLGFVATGSTIGAAAPKKPQPKVQVFYPVRHAVSPPVRELATIRPGSVLEDWEHPVHKLPRRYAARPAAFRDAALQAAATPSLKLAVSAGTAFDGIGVTTGYSITGAPPDTNGAVGATQYVQWVNTAFSVFRKSDGLKLAGPTNGNMLFTALGGDCANKNSGDPIAIYDKAADRWVLTQFALHNFSTGPFFQCIAVSQTSDATGAYNLYAYSFGGLLNDYPKVGVWSDAYYITYNMFQLPNTFKGGRACAYDRAAMIAGNPTAASVCFTDATHGGFLPSDIDGSTAPPAGEPNFVLGFDDDLAHLDLWKFHVDFVTPGNSTFTGPALIPVTPFVTANTVPEQSGTALDSLSDRMMYRLAYRNFGSHESLAATHSVDVSGHAGLRWYEIQDPNGTPTIAQQSTFSPDNKHRWMGSIAMDNSGDMLLGYSQSSSSTHPQIFVTGRTAADPAGQMQSELLVKAGAGSQTGGLSRWGDYSAMTVDPVDDKTFWYTTEFINANGSFNWSTRIASFSFQPTLAVSAPASLTVAQGGSNGATVTVSSILGFTGDTTLSASGTPSGVTTGFAPNPVTVPAGGSAPSTLTVTADANATIGNSTLTLTGTSGTTTNNTTLALTISAFQLSAPASLTTYVGSSVSGTIDVASLFGFTAATDLGVTGLPSGVTASFVPDTVTPPANGHATSTLTLSASPTAALGTVTLTINGTSGGVTHSVDVDLNVLPLLFSDGAESAGGMQVAAGPLSLTTWFRTNSDAASGSFSWEAGVPPGGSYSGLADARLTAPRLDLTGATQAGLSYRYKYQTRSTRDFLEVRASADNGRTWSVLSRVSGTSPGFPGTWNLATLSLDAFAGRSNVLVQFRLTSEVGAGGFGVLIDEIAIGKK